MRKTELFLKRFFSLNSNLGCILVALQLTVRGFAKWREIEAKSFDLDDT